MLKTKFSLFDPEDQIRILKWMAETRSVEFPWIVKSMSLARNDALLNLPSACSLQYMSILKTLISSVDSKQVDASKALESIIPLVPLPSDLPDPLHAVSQLPGSHSFLFSFGLCFLPLIFLLRDRDPASPELRR